VELQLRLDTVSRDVPAKSAAPPILAGDTDDGRQIFITVVANSNRERRQLALAARRALSTEGHLRTDDEIGVVMQLLTSVNFFRLGKDQIGEQVMLALCRVVELQKFQPAELLCRAGATAKTFVIILDGRLDVFVNSLAVGKLDVGRSFGDRALAAEEAGVSTTKVNAGSSGCLVAKLEVAEFFKLVHQHITVQLEPQQTPNSTHYEWYAPP
jgi:hypothetical protein